MTTTDWNKEAALRIQYVNWRVDNYELPCFKLLHLNILNIPNGYTPESIYRMFVQTGVLYVSDIRDAEPVVVKDYEWWLKNVAA